MKALTVRQPWAGLLVLGYKNVENRSWSTQHRGPLAIHAASASAAPEDWDRALDLLVQVAIDRNHMGDILDWCRERKGGLIGIVELYDVVDDSESPWAMEGTQHWLIAPRRSWPTMRPARGALGLWDWEG
jgi:hypothetical protein